jgi:hypothetical protein
VANFSRNASTVHLPIAAQDCERPRPRGLAGRAPTANARHGSPGGGFLQMPRNHGLLFLFLRERPPFSGLDSKAWHVFMAIACRWQANEEAWPSQETVARFCGKSSRSVRRSTLELARKGILQLRRTRLPNGNAGLRYSPGAATLAAFEAFEQGFPAAAPDVVPGQAGQAETAPGRSEEREEATPFCEEDREVARTALRAMFPPSPGQPTPRPLDEDDVALVAHCAHAVGGNRDTKLDSLRDAIEGARRRSKQPPTVRYVFARLHHFFAHAENGRRLRGRDPARGAPRGPSARREPPRPSQATPARLTREQMNADMVKLFGPSWNNREGT